MEGTCNTHGDDVKCIQNFSRKNLKGRENLGDTGVDGRIKNMCVCVRVTAFTSVRYGVQYWILFNTVINLMVP
jgi:hypothetical protein